MSDPQPPSPRDPAGPASPASPAGHPDPARPVARAAQGAPAGGTPTPDRPRTIAIDGPAGSGKSTIGRMLAARLGYLFFDTGAMYRAITWEAQQQRIPSDAAAALTALAESLPVAITRPTPAEQDGRDYTVHIAGHDVTWAIREPAVEAAVSQISAWPGVRRALVAQQRRVAEAAGRPGGAPGVVMAGRDIGTVVLPDADCKIYLDASAAERARRRFREQEARGTTLDYAATLQEITRRDTIDSTRATSPLRPADDAVIVNTDGLSVDAALARVLAVVGA